MRDYILIALSVILGVAAIYLMFDLQEVKHYDKQHYTTKHVYPIDPTKPHLNITKLSTKKSGYWVIRSVRTNEIGCTFAYYADTTGNAGTSNQEEYFMVDDSCNRYHVGDTVRL